MGPVQGTVSAAAAEGGHVEHLPPEEYYAKLHAAQPQLTKLAMELDAQSNRLQEEYRVKVEQIIAQHVSMASYN
jgi:hypothetical protein